MLKHELGEMQKLAGLHAQSRALMKRYSKAVSDFNDRNGPTVETEGLTEDIHKWLASMKAEQTRFHHREMTRIRQHWPAATWSGRMELSRWLGRHVAIYLVMDKIVYRVVRAVVGTALRSITRRH